MVYLRHYTILELIQPCCCTVKCFQMKIWIKFVKTIIWYNEHDVTIIKLLYTYYAAAVYIDCSAQKLTSEYNRIFMSGDPRKVARTTQLGVNTMSVRGLQWIIIGYWLLFGYYSLALSYHPRLKLRTIKRWRLKTCAINHAFVNRLSREGWGMNKTYCRLYHVTRLQNHYKP